MPCFILARDQIEHFTGSLFIPEDLIEIRLLPGGPRKWVPAGALSNEESALLQANKSGMNIYVGANPRKSQGGTAQDVSLARSLFVDADGVMPADLIRRIHTAGLPPATVIVASGHGAHAYWRLDAPLQDLVSWTAHQKSLINVLDTDKAIHDPPRIMRLPGFLNVKKAPYVPCHLVDIGQPRGVAYPVSRFPRTVKYNKHDTQSRLANHRVSDREILKVVHCVSERDLPKAVALARVKLEAMPPAIQGQGGDDLTYQAAAVLITDYALPFEVALEQLMEYNRRCCPPWSHEELIQKLKNASKYGKNGLGCKIPNLQVFDELETLGLLSPRDGSDNGGER